MPLIDAHHTAAAGTKSHSVRYWWVMLATGIPQRKATALIQEARHIQTPDTTAASPARALTSTGEESCPRYLAVLHGILCLCSRFSLGIGFPISTLSDREAGCHHHAGLRSSRCSWWGMTDGFRRRLPQLCDLRR